MTGESRIGTAGAIWRFLTSSCVSTPRNRRNSWRALVWIVGWMAGTIAVSGAIRSELLPAGPATYLAIAGSAALGLLALAAYARCLREGDELLRKIHLEAHALGFGGGIVGFFVLDLLGSAGVAIEMDDVPQVMAFAYLVGLVLGVRRHA